MRDPHLPLPDTHLITAETSDKILEDATIITKIGGTHRFLNRCKRKILTVDSQLDRGDLQRIDPVQHGRPNPFKLDRVEFSPPGRMMQTSTRDERAEETDPRSPSPS